MGVRANRRELMKKSILLVILPVLIVLGTVLSDGCTTLKRLAYEGLGRDDWQQPERVISALGIQQGETIADLGAGSGYFTFRLADATGSSGTVYAADVDRGIVEYLNQRAREGGYKNVRGILSESDDPLLPPHGIDLIFSCNTYHHLKRRVDYFTNMRKYLRDGGRVAIIDFSGKTWFQRLLGHITPVEVIKFEMEAAGYRLKDEHDFLSKQGFLVFSK